MKIGRIEIHPAFPYQKLPSLCGWILALLSIEEATFAGDFLLFPSETTLWGIYGLRLAFFVGLGLAILILSKYPHFPAWVFALAANVCLLLSFLPLLREVLFPLRLLFSLFAGLSTARFGIDFFLSFDNRQKGISLLLAFALAPFLFLLQQEPYLSLCLLALPGFFLFFPYNIPKKAEPLPLEDVPEWWLLLLAFSSFLLNGALELSFLRELFLQSSSSSLWAFGGSFAGLFISLFFLKSRRFFMSHGLYFSFWISALGGLALFFAPDPIALALTASCLGAAHTIGLFSLYYVLGVYTKKYWNLPFYHGGALFSSLAYGLSLLLALLAPFSLQQENRYYPAIFIAFPLLLSLVIPSLFERKNTRAWLTDLHREEVSHEEGLSLFLHDHHFSPREIEVTSLLLQGLTLKQIALELHLSYPTINTYQNGIYRKLGINSRAELILLCHPFLEKNVTH